MRQVEANWYRDFLYNLSMTKGRYDSAVSQASSGKRLNHLSDDPADMSYVLNLRSKIGQINQFDQNINSGSTYLSYAESGISAVQTTMYTIVSLAEQGASESTDADSRNILADRIDELRNEILNYANTEVNGRFIFAGSNIDTPPYVKGADYLVGGITRPGDITYQGDYEYMDIQADFSVTVSTNIPGNEVFGDSTVAAPPYDIFARLADLVYNLRNNDTTALGNDISSMNELINQLGESLGTVGNNVAHLREIKGMLKSFKTSLQSQMSSLEDANMAEAISNLAKEEVGLQATLQVGARINRVSLMNYLG